MISTKSKLSHGLVYSDVRPRDKQNFSSCQKICSEQTIKLVQDSMVDTPGGKGMIIYLRLMQSVMTAYYERNIRLLDRLHNCWLSVFICRLWWIWLNSQPRTKLKDQYNVVFDSLRSILSKDFNEKIKMPKEPKKSTTWNFFISIASYLSIELNAHSLTYLVLLAIYSKIPWHVLSIDRFNS